MALSEHEQKLLEEMERALYAEDPRFASSMRDSGPRAGRSARTGLLSLLVVMGIAGIVAGQISQIAFIGIVGFIFVLGGLYGIISAALAQGGPAKTADPRSAKKRGPGYLNKAEERFRNRRDGVDDH
jgi:hypothetical protein